MKRWSAVERAACTVGALLILSGLIHLGRMAEAGPRRVDAWHSRAAVAGVADFEDGMG